MKATEFHKSSFRGVNVLVLGGSGVIGSRLVEVLAENCGAHVSVLVRNLTKAVRIARYGVELVQGEVSDGELLGNLMARNTIVIDCTFPKEGDFKTRCENGRSASRTIGEAAVSAAISRLVHLSTISVYGPTPDGVLNEESPKRPGRDAYSASKLAGEEEMLRQYRESGLPVVVLQPTVVYGPFAGWTLGPLTALKRGDYVLPNDGDGICNAVYLDDVIQAILRAAVASGVEGETFLVSGDPPVTWKEFYGAYSSMLACPPARGMSTEDLMAEYARRKKAATPVRRLIATLRSDGGLRQTVLSLPGIAQVYGLARKFTPEQRMDRIKDRLMDRQSGTSRSPSRPIQLPAPAQLAVFSLKTSVSIEKAKQHLGYQPFYDLDSGMALTRQWAEWARQVRAS